MRIIHATLKLSFLGTIALAAGLSGCSAEGGRGRGGGQIGENRGEWQNNGKADAADATCAGVCGDQAAAGCWCDSECATYGDCCSDKAAVCDGEEPVAAGEPGEPLGTFKFTYYWVTVESAFGGAKTAKLYDDKCKVLANVSEGFSDAIRLEGTGRLEDGRVLNYWGNCGCSSDPCYFEVDDTHPWGHGVQNRALSPFRSVAVDRDVVSYGTKLYIEELDGVTMPGEAPWGGFVHDGCVTADDTGSAINNKHLDFFAARKGDYLSLNGVLGISQATVREGGDRCAEGGGGGGGGGGDDGGGEDPPAGGGDEAGQLCFPGPSGDDSVCVPLVPASAVGSGYGYPAPFSGDVNYRAPINYIDLEEVGEMQVAANFFLSEVAQSWKGRYAVVQPHAIRHLQDIRDELGAIQVNSGYRNPSYNSSVGGATHSRHLYGDAFDLKALSTGLSTLESACTNHGGKLIEYNDHVHCDWRFDNVNSLLFGATAVGGAEPDFALAAGLEAHLEQLGEQWYAPAEGFDEGEPMRRWKALDADGEIIDEATGESFSPPSGTATVEVLVGAQIELVGDVYE